MSRHAHNKAGIQAYTCIQGSCDKAYAHRDAQDKAMSGHSGCITWPRRLERILATPHKVDASVQSCPLSNHAQCHRKHKENQTRPCGLHASFLPLVGLPLAVPLPEKLKKRKGRTHQSRDPEGCTYQSGDPKGYTYQSSDPEGCTCQSSDLEGCTYQSSDPEGCTYQSSDPEGCTYQSSDPEGCTYQSSDLEGYTYP
ncbi:NBS-LRR type resistance protein [Cucumis melo var. makuwa]|uniref:NBS-LRR type resistance protein n=1 Tax=Cucumis melo var. makuwa TaxID=1194695 RepID=A0A5A7SYK3_CUCMM|nr:NBS-LRR type resistance protein [Cucumis melo var. makuwa]TYK30848.1 NBS-LRR type resistance protein [Cucumis melo var. makuwa]